MAQRRAPARPGAHVWGTWRCNLKCAYCDQERLNRPDMSEEVLEATTKWINVNGVPKLNFFGGEPFTHPYSMKYLIAKTNCKSYGVTTNGTILTEDLWDWIRLHGVKVALSFDGLEEIQNRYRDNSYDLVMRNMPAWLMATSNVLTTYVDPVLAYEACRNIRGLGFRAVFQNILHPFGFGYTEEQIGLMEEMYTKTIKDLHDPPRFQIADFTKTWQVMQSRKRHNYKPGCGINRKGLGIDTDGLIYPCFPPGVMIQTDKGPHPVEDLQTKEVRSHDGSFNSIIEKFERDYEGLLIKISPWLMDPLPLTPEHPLFVLRENEETLIPARAVLRTDCVIYPIPSESQETEVIRLSDLFSVLYYHVKSDTVLGLGSKKPVVNTIPVDDAFLDCIGWFAAEGSTIRARSNNLHGLPRESYSFKLGMKEDSVVKRLDTYLRGLGGKPTLSYDDEHHSIGIQEHNPVLASLFGTLCGIHARDKHLPDFLMELPPSTQRVLLQSILFGDGGSYSSSGGYYFSSISPRLAYQVRDLLLRQDIIPRFKHYSRKRSYSPHAPFEEYRVVVYKGDISSLQPSTYRRKRRSKAWIENGKVYYQIRKIEKQTYSGPVYNLAVQNTNTYIANGLSVHNCHRGMELGKEFAIGSVFNGIDPVRENRIRRQVEVVPQACKECGLGCLPCPVNSFRECGEFGVDPDEYHCEAIRIRTKVVKELGPSFGLDKQKRKGRVRATARPISPDEVC